VVLKPARDHPGAELGAQVDRQVRHPEAVGELASAAHGLCRAAAQIAVVLGIGPQLKGHPDGLGASLGDEQRGHGAVDAAAHRHERAPWACLQLGLLACGCAERAVQSVGCELGGVALARAESASSAAISEAPMRAACSSGVWRTRATTALPAAIVAPQPLASKANVGDTTLCVAWVKRERDPDQVAAGSTAGSTCNGV